MAVTSILPEESQIGIAFSIMATCTGAFTLTDTEVVKDANFGSRSLHRPWRLIVANVPPWLCRVIALACGCGAMIGLLLAVPGTFHPLMFSPVGTVIGWLGTCAFSVYALVWWRRANVF